MVNAKKTWTGKAVGVIRYTATVFFLFIEISSPVEKKKQTKKSLQQSRETTNYDTLQNSIMERKKIFIEILMN